MGQQMIAPETTALAQVTSAEIDVQIATARRFSRDKAEVVKLGCEAVSRSQEVAAAMTFTLPRLDKEGRPITGKSVRLAEVLATVYGNLRVSVRAQEPAPGDRFVAAQAAAMDLENNTVVVVEKHRRITGSDGRRYNDDMIGMTIAAASAIAFREAVFKIADPMVVSAIYDKAQAVALGDPSKVAAYREKALLFFGSLGFSPQDVYSMVGIKQAANAHGDLLTLAHLRTLNGIKVALADGDTTVEDIRATISGVSIDVSAIPTDADESAKTALTSGEVEGTDDAPADKRKRKQ